MLTATVKCHVMRGAAVLCLAAAATTTLTAQWYQTYDQAVAAVKRRDWKAAEEKFDQARKEAAAAKQKPGRRVFRFGNLWLPFLPDYYLVEVYAGLAEQAPDDATRKGYIERAVQASNDAVASGQVRKTDAEFGPMSGLVARLGGDIGKPGDVVTVVEPPTPTPVDPLQSSRRDVQDLLTRGDRALAAQTWEDAKAAFQQASARLDATQALKPEFPQVASRMAEAALGADVSSGLRQLASGAFAGAADTLDRAVRTASNVTASSQAVRSLIADAPKRLAEARLGQALVLADTNRQQRQWANAISAYESAQRAASGVEATSARIKQLQADLPARLQEAKLQLALTEKRYGDALTIDPRNAVALAGQYQIGFDLSRQGEKWEDALKAFDVLLNANPGYSDAAERRLVAEIQVEYRHGIEVEATNPTAALAHYRQVGTLQQRVRGPLAESPDVITPSENASSRVRRITADAALNTARQLFQDGKWDEARASANFVIGVFPDDERAKDLLQRLADRGLQQKIADLAKRSADSLQRGDLFDAQTAATQLLNLVPDNKAAKEILANVVAAQEARRRRYPWILASIGLVVVGPLLLVSSKRRARFLAVIGQPAAALTLYERVLSRAPTDGETLTSAARLAAAHRLPSGLEPYFSAYLLSRPEDHGVAMLAADHFWTNEAQSKAIDVYVRSLATGRVALPAVAYEHLLEFYGAGIPDATLQSVARARQRDPDNVGLIRLLAHEYARHGRSDAEALSAYQTAAAASAPDGTLLLAYARALLAQGDPSAAAAQAARASMLRPDDEAPLDILHDVYLRMRAAAHDDVPSHLERLKLSPPAVLVVGERLCHDAPDLRPSISSLYGRLAATADDPDVSRLVRLHRHLDLLEFEPARMLLDAAATAPASRLKLRALIQAHERLAATMAAHGKPSDTQLLARTAQLYSEGDYWGDAVNTWQQLVAVPEWNRRSMSAIQDVIDRLPVAQMSQIYFRTAGWRVDAEKEEESPTVVEYRVTPGAALSKELAEPFSETQVFCYGTVVSVDDLIEVKRRMLAARGTAGDAVAFLAASQAIRHDVYALIYAFMTEEPSLTVIPIEAQAIRDALVEARSRAHLERTLHQWLGHTDIYETHNPVANAATFFGRGQFINQLVLKISRGENFGIFGLRKIGKTSLVYRLRELSRDHLVAYVDLQGVASRRVGDVYARLLESLVRDLRIKHPDVTVPPLTTNAGAADVATAFRTDVVGIRAAFEALNRPLPHVLLLLDEIELMIPEGQSPGFEGHQEFFRHVRGLYQQERFIVSAVVGATPSVCRTAKWNGRDNPVFQFYDEVFLAPLDRSECDQMVQGLGELMGVRFDIESLATIYDMTAGHPYVARQLCSRLVKSFVERPLEVHATMVEAAAAEYLAQRGDYFAGILEGYLDPVACRMVEAIAAADEAGVTRNDLFQQIEAVGAGRAIRDQTLGDLEVTGLAVHAGDRYRLRIPLFRRWLRRSWLGLE